MRRLLIALLAASTCFALDNAIRVYDVTGSAQSNRAVHGAHGLREGRVPGGHLLKPRVNGVVPSTGRWTSKAGGLMRQCYPPSCHSR